MKTCLDLFLEMFLRGLLIGVKSEDRVDKELDLSCSTRLCLGVLDCLGCLGCRGVECLVPTPLGLKIKLR